GLALRDRVASGVVGGAVDAKARGKASHRLRHGVGRPQQVLLSVHRRDVRQNRQGHSEYTSVVCWVFSPPAAPCGRLDTGLSTPGGATLGVSTAVWTSFWGRAGLRGRQTGRAAIGRDRSVGILGPAARASDDDVDVQ